MAERAVVYYTFGNHMHWVDMEWLWGYDVLPGSVRDMLRLCNEAGVKGCVNFDGIGYEKLASEDPDAFGELREAVHSGLIEPVGCSYGQPYGQFHGGESNIRQRVYGVRTVMRLLGVRPRTFWEEEFDFFPQLPQVLAGVGITGASLFFQWTWHTPELPREDVPTIMWEGLDGTRLPAATRNQLNLHQWPEDMDAVFAELARTKARPGADAQPLLLQWLELMPSPDWMCRAELILPKLRALLADPQIEVVPCTLGEYLASSAEHAPPVRRYAPDETWHGLSLGKNGDDMRRRSIAAENELLAAETLATIMSAFGRPYAQWDVYPVWELEEAWRELLSAQHHDNDECEGLCGHIGKLSYDRSIGLSGHVLEANLRLLSRRIAAEEGSVVVYNPLGWERCDTLAEPASGRLVVARDVPSMGFRAYRPEELAPKTPCWNVCDNGAELARGERGSLACSVLRTGQVLIEGSAICPTISFPGLAIEGCRESEEGDLVVSLGGAAGTMEAWLKLPGDVAALDITLKCRTMRRPDPGFAGAMYMEFDSVRGEMPELLQADHPYGVSQVGQGAKGVRKYPEGDWMTSPQWFEQVEGAFTCSTFLNLPGLDGSSHTLIAHDGSQQWFRRKEGVRCVLNLYDPWDEQYFTPTFECRFRLLPHDGMSLSRMWRIAQEFRRPVRTVIKQGPPGDIPPLQSFASCDADAVCLTSLHREVEQALNQGGGCGGYPVIARLVEMDGGTCEATLRTHFEAVDAVWTNLLGEPTNVEGLRKRFGPHEIATLYMDLPACRKHARDLDASREVWADVHRRAENL